MPTFLLSPARTGGPRSQMLLREGADFDLARRLRAGEATIGEVYSFISGLYFRGKIAYVEAFGNDARIIVPGRGLIPAATQIDSGQLRAIGDIPIEEDNEAYLIPLLRDAAMLDEQANKNALYVLLGSVATAKYTQPLLQVFGNRLLFPANFVGRGDMSRGGLMLRCATSKEELRYIPVDGAILRGQRPPKLDR